MFTLTITTRDYIPFTIRGSSVDLLTCALVLQSGLQMRQSIGVEVSSERGSAKIDALRNAGQLVDAINDCIAFCTPRGEEA